ncbi:DUF6869 domain-containing protein [Pseudomonas sp. CNPSo 3701]|uniref:DUF6869 domain-containing protein n=1 Tax=Pseudomonas sp. CNPSo 3701 TaxID=3027943 RepID=UPI002364884C|nr:hypothetical protein [Pseudomonas sp. CNPSo 3701]MDD1508904.1 hypothetical protein [Pseudomonas sp. CNPSo 3701]
MKLEEFAIEWVKAIENLDQTTGIPWTESFLTDLWLKGKHEQIWEFIVHTSQKDLPENVAGYLAAGPLEDLLASAGPVFIERVELLANSNQKFKTLLQGVWRNEIEEAVWLRMQAILASG